MGNSIPVRSEAERQRAILALQHRRPPFTVTLTKGEPRSLAQNRLQRLWLKEAEEQGDQTAEEYRAWCKLTIGVPILRADNDAFCAQYDAIIRPLPYERKLELMRVPIDFPVTRLMTTGQLKQYLDAMYQHFSGQGFHLTDPDWQGLDVA
jgi:hypothetical protein